MGSVLRRFCGGDTKSLPSDVEQFDDGFDEIRDSVYTS